MKLMSIQFEEFQGTPRAWKLDNLELQTINLLVGKNASGKTRTLNVINSLAKLLSGNLSQLFESGNFEAVFANESEKFQYKLEISDKRVHRESLKRGQKILLDRKEGGFGRVYAEKQNRLVNFQTPEDQLAAVARQDSLQHSFFQVLRDWADSVLHFEFGGSLGRTSISIPVKDEESKFDPKNTNSIVPFLQMGIKAFGGKFQNAIIADLIEIGYDVSEIGLRTPLGIQITGPVSVEAKNIYVKEDGLRSETDQIYMSQGMFRALSVIVQLNYIIFSKSSACLLIDDIGEGLDFDRSTSLIALVIEKVKSSNGQLIMATNDRFTMNRTPLKVWTVLHRDGSNIHVFNYKNSRKRFEEFQFTGLSNFDFFSSEYVLDSK